MRILVLSTFDVWPARDGGQTRYVNIWGRTPSHHEVTILVYDFRNTVSERRYKLSKNVEVIVPKASKGDARHFYYMAQQTGLWLHDVLCLTDYSFSSDFKDKLIEKINVCDVLVSSHPYLATYAFPMAGCGIKKVYESHNVEFDIKSEYFASSHIDISIYLSAVRIGEEYAMLQSDIVTAVSAIDKSRLANLYAFDESKIYVVPNGANLKPKYVFSDYDRNEIRRYLKLDKTLVGIFLGSSYPANVKSYLKTREMLQSSGFTGTIILVGTIDKARSDSWADMDFEERWFGFVDEPLKEMLLSISDFALNLVFAGAGTNLKLYDYMGAGIPVIANKFGQRGVDYSGWCLPGDTLTEVVCALEALTNFREKTLEIAIKARAIALKEFDWQAISYNFIQILEDIDS